MVEPSLVVEVVVLNVTCVVFVDAGIHAADGVTFVNLSLDARCWNVPSSDAFGCFRNLLNGAMATSEGSVFV